MSTTTIKQLAIALNTDVDGVKALFITSLQEANEYDKADEVSKWVAATPIPDWCDDAAKKAGVDMSRKRHKKVGGKIELANPENIVSAFLEQLPQLINANLISQQQSFTAEAKFSGTLTGIQGALAFQQSLLEGFTATNDAFRQTRAKGIENMQNNVSEQFAGLYDSLCDTWRNNQANVEQTETENDRYSEVIKRLQAAMNPVVDNEDLGK
jgi:hypothetical protein